MAAGMRDEELLNAYGRERISARQIDELVGIARGLCADGALNEKEVEFLRGWLAANVGISGQPLIATLYRRVDEILRDGIADADECAELMETLTSLSAAKIETGEALKATRLPLCEPAPVLTFPGRSYCFTGTFSFGGRRQCEAEVGSRGGAAGSLTRKTDILVIGIYATESWKHSAFGNKILKACDMRDSGVPIAIVSEEHWVRHL